MSHYLSQLNKFTTVPIDTLEYQILNLKLWHVNCEIKITIRGPTHNFMSGRVVA